MNQKVSKKHAIILGSNLVQFLKIVDPNHSTLSQHLKITKMSHLLMFCNSERLRDLFSEMVAYLFVYKQNHA